MSADVTFISSPDDPPPKHIRVVMQDGTPYDYYKHRIMRAEGDWIRVYGYTNEAWFFQPRAVFIDQ